MVIIIENVIIIIIMIIQGVLLSPPKKIEGGWEIQKKISRSLNHGENPVVNGGRVEADAKFRPPFGTFPFTPSALRIPGLA